MTKGELSGNNEGNYGCLQNVRQTNKQFNVRRLKGRSPISFLDLCEDANDIEELIEDKHGVYDVDENGNTLLHIAISNKKLDVCEMLIQRMDNFDIQGENGNTFLHLAILNRDFDIAKILINKMQNLNIKNNQGDTPLHFALEYNMPEIAEYLIRRGAALDQANNNGEISLHIATRNRLDETAEMIINYDNSTINYSDNKGNMPIHYACQNGADWIVHCLIREQKELNRQNSNGETPLMIAAQRLLSVSDITHKDKYMGIIEVLLSIDDTDITVITHKWEDFMAIFDKNTDCFSTEVERLYEYKLEKISGNGIVEYSSINNNYIDDGYESDSESEELYGNYDVERFFEGKSYGEIKSPDCSEIEYMEDTLDSEIEYIKAIEDNEVENISPEVDTEIEEDNLINMLKNMKNRQRENAKNIIMDIEIL